MIIKQLKTHAIYFSCGRRILNTKTRDKIVPIHYPIRVIKAAIIKTPPTRSWDREAGSYYWQVCRLKLRLMTSSILLSWVL